MSVPMPVARVAVSPRFAETHSARASRQAAGSGRHADVSSRASSGLASVRAPRTTRWRASRASSSLSSPGARGDARRQTVHRAFASTSAGLPAVGPRTDQRSSFTDSAAEVETKDARRARRRMDGAIARGDAETRSETTETFREKNAPRASDPELVRLPSGDAVAPWWAHGSDLANVADVRSPEEYAARMEEAKAMSLSRARPVVVCVEFFAGWCFACRALHPKMTKIASEEFADVLFLRVRKDECPALCDAMGIEKLPYVRIVSCFENRAARADAFTVNLTAPKLRKLRAALATHARGLGGGERRKPVAWREEE